MLLLTARVLTIPLGQLTLAARRIAEGNYDTRIPDNLPRDEIGQLALTLNQVVGQLVAQLSRLRAAAQVSRVAASNLEQEQLLTQVLRSITHQFDVPDVRIYQADSKTDRATIIAALGAEGEILLRQKHQVPLDESTLVGRALVLRSPQLGGGVDAPAFAGAKVRNAEIALPLITAGRLIGTLHIIGDRPGEFDADDVDVLSLVADQLSAAINNAQLLEQGQTNIAEIEALNRRLTRQGWEDYIKEAPNLRHTLDPEAEWPEIAVASLEASGEAIRAETYTDHQGRNIIAVPLVLRGESIGTIAATRPSGHQWNREEITVVESVAARMSMIAEGIRLLEESERRTRVEQQVNTVSAELLQRASSVESVLQAALNQLSGTLGSDHISLRIGAPPVQSDHQIDSGDGGRGGQNGRADNAEQSVGAGQQDQGMSDA
jgi:GAF domain-containing protein